jgi:HEAT repeat protein
MLRHLFLVIALSLVATDAIAQSVAAPILALRTARSPGGRVRAIEDIARMRPVGGRAALEEALRDRAPSVRRAAAISLGELGDPAAIAALEAARRDPDRNVQRAAAASVRALATLSPVPAPPGNATSEFGQPAAAVRWAPIPVDWRTVRMVVSIDRIANRAGATPAEIEFTREIMRQAAQSTAGVALHPGGALPAIAQQRLRTRALRWFALEGSVMQLQRQQDATGVRVRAELSLAIVSEPSHNIVGTLSTAASAQEPLPPPSAPEPWTRLSRTALETVARGAIQRMQEQFAQPTRGRRR